MSDSSVTLKLQLQGLTWDPPCAHFQQPDQKVDAAALPFRDGRAQCMARLELPSESLFCLRVRGHDGQHWCGLLVNTLT